MATIQTFRPALSPPTYPATVTDAAKTAPATKPAAAATVQPKAETSAATVKREDAGNPKLANALWAGGVMSACASFPAFCILGSLFGPVGMFIGLGLLLAGLASVLIGGAIHGPGNYPG